MGKAPLVSVIMPAYNCENTILRSVQSALAQTVDDIELIIVNDYSADSTSEIIAELVAADTRVLALGNPANSGVAVSRNRAIEAASGKYLAFLDSDDLWEPDKLKKQLELVDSTGCDLCYSSYDYFNEDGSAVYKPYLVPEAIDYDGLLKENVIGLSTVLLSKSALGGSLFDAGLFHEDYALWLKLLRAGVVARGLSEVLTHNRVGGRSQNKWKAFMKRWEVYRKSERLPVLRACGCMMGYVVAGMMKYRKYAV